MWVANSLKWLTSMLFRCSGLRRAAAATHSLRSATARHARPLCAGAGGRSVTWSEARFTGATVALGVGPLASDFGAQLDTAMAEIRAAQRKGVWMRVPIEQAAAIPLAARHGFKYHHAEGDYAMLLAWLPADAPCPVPDFATHGNPAAAATAAMTPIIPNPYPLPPSHRDGRHVHQRAARGAGGAGAARVHLDLAGQLEAAWRPGRSGRGARR